MNFWAEQKEVTKMKSILDQLTNAFNTIQTVIVGDKKWYRRKRWHHLDITYGKFELHYTYEKGKKFER